MRKFLIYSVFIFLISYCPRLTQAAAPSELKDAINQKSQELQVINDKIKENQKNLEGVQTQSRTLQQEISNVDSNISNVSLGIQSSELTINKLGLEITSLGYDIPDTEKQITAKQEAVVKLLREFQQKDGESPFLILLKNKSLADSVFEIQNLTDLNNGLSNEVEDLKNTKIALNNQLQEAADKKQLTQIEKENLKNKQLILNETKKEKQTVLVQSKNQEQVYQKMTSDLQKRQMEIADEIDKIEAELRAKIDPSLLPLPRPGVLAIPVNVNLVISQTYGETIFAQRYNPVKWHNGLDFAGPIGTPILAAEKGVVLKVGNQDLYCPKGAYGKYIVIKHENNLTTLYGHLSLQIVKNGDYVERGEVIGYMGKSGWATGSHLHFTVWDNFTFNFKQSKICGLMPVGGDINPASYLDLKI